MMIKALFLKILAAVVTVVMATAAGVSKTPAYDVRDPEACELNFSILSDSHIETNNFTRYKVFTHALQDTMKNKSGNDAVIFLGDNTMNCQFLENLLFHGAVRKYMKDQTVLPVMGNHDIGNGEGDYEKLQNRWYAYTEAFFGKKLTVPYYREVIDGYSFIVLGTEEHTSNSMTLTDGQLAWLRGTLEDAARSGKPVFVFSHHPERASYRANPAYEYSLTDILTAYAEDHDLFYFSGHTHRTLTRSSFNTYYNFPEISLPCLTTLTGEKDNVIKEDTGVGVEVEVYGDEVIVRGRNFYQGEWDADSAGEPLEIAYPLRNPVS